MDMIESWMQNYLLQDPEDMDALLEAADLTRQLIKNRNYPDLNTLIAYTIENGLYECFSWVMSLLQEEFEKEAEYDLDDFVCLLGHPHWTGRLLQSRFHQERGAPHPSGIQYRHHNGRGDAVDGQ